MTATRTWWTTFLQELLSTAIFSLYRSNGQKIWFASAVTGFAKAIENDAVRRQLIRQAFSTTSDQSRRTTVIFFFLTVFGYSNCHGTPLSVAVPQSDKRGARRMWVAYAKTLSRRQPLVLSCQTTLRIAYRHLTITTTNYKFIAYSYRFWESTHHYRVVLASHR